MPAAQHPPPAITATPSVVATSVPLATPEPSSSPTSTVEPPEVITYTVQAGDELLQIAIDHDTTVEAIVEASRLISPADLIYPGDVLTIPLHTVTQATQELTPSPEGEIPIESSTPESGAQTWHPSLLEGDLASAYPSTWNTERFILHFTPDTYPAQDPQAVAAMVTRGLGHIETVMNAHLEGRFDVYVAGGLFEPPDQALRGRSFSAARRYFFLHDGTGNPADQQYIATHELTHLFTWNVFGRPVSAMLSEGAAVYTGMELIADSDHMPIKTFCTAYHQAGRLPRVSTSLGFQGHIHDLENYYAAGCFVQYLIETYGSENFGQLYPTGDYAGVYGQSLAALEADWLVDLEANGPTVPFNPDNLIEAVDSVGTAYDELFTGFTGTPAQMAAYPELDAARIALLEERFNDVNAHLIAFDQRMGQ